MKYTYIPRGVCSRQINLEINDGIIESCEFIGGCAGNTQGICALVKGMDAEEAVKRLKGIDCRMQRYILPRIKLSYAIEEALELE